MSTDSATGVGSAPQAGVVVEPEVDGRWFERGTGVLDLFVALASG